VTNKKNFIILFSRSYNTFSSQEVISELLLSLVTADTRKVKGYILFGKSMKVELSVSDPTKYIQGWSKVFSQNKS